MDWSSNYAKIKKYDIANGEGLRTSIFLSGCDFKCKGCFNEELWNYECGRKMSDEALQEIFDSMNEHIDGISILGGEPLNPKNIETTYKIIKEFYENFPNKTIWLWTGYELEELFSFELELSIDNEILQRNVYLDYIINHINTIVVGRYKEELKDPNLMYKGSSNQRVINLKECILKNN